MGLDARIRYRVDYKKIIDNDKKNEIAYTNQYFNYGLTGIYSCKCCGNKLFLSIHKYNSGVGFPSFSNTIKDSVIIIENKLAMSHKLKVHCRNCNLHLGWLYFDGPFPTGLRFTVYSSVLAFVEDIEVLKHSNKTISTFQY